MTNSLPVPATTLTQAQQNALVNLVRRAARSEIMPRFRQLASSDIHIKSEQNDLVTEADHAAERMIGRGIQQMFPHALVVGEEAVAADPSLRDKIAKSELAFIIDPVDGTWNFVHGLPLFGVILSVARYGVTTFGMLYDPVVDDWIIADQDNPARISRTLGADQAVTVTEGGELEDLSGYIHFYLLPKDKQLEMAAALPEFRRTLSLRCSCHEYRTLAQGAMDFCLSAIPNPWDHAAGVLICRQAGGYAAMLDGREYTADVTDGYVLTAPNKATWEKLRDRFSFLLEG